MTFRTLILRSLRFHWRAHLGVLLGAAVGSAALIGALVVGDSVHASLRWRAVSRLGGIHFAISTHDRLFRSDLRQRLATDRGPNTPSIGRPLDTKTPAYVLPFDANPSASALLLAGMVVSPASGARANHANVLGVEPEAWPSLAVWGTVGPGRWNTDRGRPLLDGIIQMHMRELDAALARWQAGETVLVNETLARQLSAKIGDEVIVRVRKPSALGLDAAISPRDDTAVAMRFKIGAILTADQLGDFSLAANQAPPANLFLPLNLLARKVGAEGRANMLVSGPLSRKPKFTWFDAQRHSLAGWLRRRAFRPVPADDRMPGSRGPSWFEDQSTWFSRAGRGLEPETARPLADETALPLLNAELARTWLPEDGELAVRVLEPPQTATGGEFVRPCIEVSSPRIFLDPPVVSAALTPRRRLLTGHRAIPSDTTNDLAASAWVTNGSEVLTYLVNLIQAGDRATPYSMVTAAGPPFTPPDLRDDEMVVNDWLADDLQVKPGDAVRLIYFLADSGSRLVERTNEFRVRAVVPMRGVYADRTLMPEFPGLAKAEKTRDWDTGFALVHKLRPKDEGYWDQFRGTPKAFVTLAAGQKMWSNRYGELTAIRYPVPTNSFGSVWREVAYRNLLANLDPGGLGLRFEPVREQALKAAEQSQDFGGLFLGFSFFLIAAALLLMALLLQLGVEQRTMEVGTLLTLGFQPKQVRWLLLGEGVLLASTGSVIGAAGGVGYAWAMLRGLATIWRDAVGAAALEFHATPGSVLIGIFASVVAAALAVWLTLRGLARRPARELLAGEAQIPMAKGRSRAGWVAAVSLALALGTLAWAAVRGETANAGVFFSAGALLLIAGMAFVAARLAGRTGVAPVSEIPGNEDGDRRDACPTLSSLALSGATRRRTRSLATVGLLACGAFLIVSIGVFRLDANRDAAQRSSGTGGFALIGEATLPVVHDLNAKAGREAFGLGAEDLAGVNVVSFRVRDGDEASCLNLNRAQKPRLLGAKPEALAGRFTFAEVAKGMPHDGWALLSQGGRTRESAADFTTARRPSNQPPSHDGSHVGEISAIGDLNSILWAMGKKVGDTLDYVDERGQPFKVRLVGAVANSILQGSLIIDEAEFVKRFPNESGSRFFLIDTPTNAPARVSASLSRALQDYGLELTPAAQRLAQFNAVQNTYLGTFQVLGGLGLLLGSAGLGVVVLRNVLERRGELAVLLAVGFRKRVLHRLVLVEHGALLALGLGVGVISAAVAVLPALLSPGTQLPWLSLSVTLGAVLVNGALWTWLATRSALRGNLLEALRNE